MPNAVLWYMCWLASWRVIIWFPCVLISIENGKSGIFYGQMFLFSLYLFIFFVISMKKFHAFCLFFVQLTTLYQFTKIRIRRQACEHAFNFCTGHRGSPMRRQLATLFSLASPMVFTEIWLEQTIPFDHRPWSLKFFQSTHSIRVKLFGVVLVWRWKNLLQKAFNT